MGIPSAAWTKIGPKQNLPPRWHVLPTGINWKAADRAYQEGIAEGLRALEQIRRGRGKKLTTAKLYHRLWDLLWQSHATRRTRWLSERIWESVGKAA